MKKVLFTVWLIYILPYFLAGQNKEMKIFLVDGIEATATLSDPSDTEESSFQRTGRYSVRNLLDNDRFTCWAVGKGGMGEKLYIACPVDVKAIRIVNGLAKDKKLFAANNRVKKFKVTLYAGFSTMAQITEIGRDYVVLPFKETKEISLKDSMDEQIIKFPFDWKKAAKLQADVEKQAKNWISRQERKDELMKDVTYAYILSLEIKGLYKGNKYNDTCISELGFVPGETKAVTEKDLAWGWKVISSDLDCEEILLDIGEDKEHSFRSFLNERPLDIGEWKLENGTLTIATSRFTNVYSRISLENNILKFNTSANDEQKFERIKIK